MNKISRRQFLQMVGLAGAMHCRPLWSQRTDTSRPIVLFADCIQAWTHPSVEMAYNALFIGLPFGSVRARLPQENHWMLGQSVDCRNNDADRCSRFGPSPQPVPEAVFIVSWITSRVDVFGRRYTVISNLVQTNLIPYPDP